MIQSVNPATGVLEQTFVPHSPDEVDARLTELTTAQQKWREVPLAERAVRMADLAVVLRERRDELAQLVTAEMGKPIVQAEGEIDKCASVSEFFSGPGVAFLEPVRVRSPFDDAIVRFDPLGVILAVMPWNYPFWQVFRQLVPALLAGNTVALKHASNVPRCALAIEDVVATAGFPAGVVRTLLVPASSVRALIEDPRVSAVTVTGSSEVGALVASQAGGVLKKQVLELGGSDPFIVLEDADLDAVVEEAVKARNLNAGQTCVAAKRFIVSAPVVDAFSTRMAAGVGALVVGDPLDRRTDVGPLARPELVGTLASQVRRSVEMGAHLLVGGTPIKGPGCYFAPGVLAEVTPSMPVFEEETFGPVAAIIAAADDDRAVELANGSQYGLGASIWTKDSERALAIAARLDVGAVFVNARVSSDPSLPFGGVKRSGYGRELGELGVRELTNVKSVALRRVSGG